jgi:hypothetical protein
MIDVSLATSPKPVLDKLDLSGPICLSNHLRKTTVLGEVLYFNAGEQGSPRGTVRVELAIDLTFSHHSWAFGHLSPCGSTALDRYFRYSIDLTCAGPMQISTKRRCDQA